MDDVTDTDENNEGDELSLIEAVMDTEPEGLMVKEMVGVTLAVTEAERLVDDVSDIVADREDVLDLDGVLDSEAANATEFAGGLNRSLVSPVPSCP
jgi:hypothetical protein